MDETYDMNETCDKETPLCSLTNPSYYKGRNLWSADVIEDFELGWHLGSATKYILRHGKKGDVRDARLDIRKAIWYLQRYLMLTGKDSDTKTV